MTRIFSSCLAALLLTAATASAQSGLPATSRPLNDCGDPATGSDTINEDCSTDLPKARLPSPGEERKLLEEKPVTSDTGQDAAVVPRSDSGNAPARGSSGGIVGGSSGGVSSGNSAVSGSKF